MPLICPRLLRALSLSAGLAALAAPAAAQGEPPGFYGTLYVQFSRLGSTSFDETGGGGLGPGLKASFGSGVGFGGDLGYRYGNGWAAEVEWNYRRHDLDALRSGGATVATEGDYASNTLFVNGLRRFAGPASGWTPYLGAGIGWVQEIDFDIASAGVERGYSKGGALAIQLIGGVERALGTHWSLAADLRWMRVGGVGLAAEEGVTGRIAKPAYNPLSVQIGLRRRF